MVSLKNSILLIAAIWGLSGCATLHSSTLETSADVSSRGQGLIAYSLPRAYLRAELYQPPAGAGAAGVRLRVLAPYNLPDSRYQLMLSARPSALSNDTFRVSVDPATGLLQSVNTTVEDQTIQVLEALARSAGGVSALGRTARGQATGPLAQVDFDPLDPASVAAAEATLRDVLPESLRSELALSVEAPPGAFPTTSQVAAACEHVICAPVYSTVTVRGSFRGRTAIVAAAVPDARRLARIDFRRSPFVARGTNATFNQGAMATVSVTKPSEAVGAASIPISVIRAALSSVTEVIQLRVNVNNAQRNLDQSRPITPSRENDTDMSGRSAGAGEPDVLFELASPAGE